MDGLIILGAILLGTVVAALLACLPALHVYNVAGVLILGVLWLGDQGIEVPAAAIGPFMTALVVAYAMVNTVPSIFLGTPDESALFLTLPGQKYLMQGRGYEATLLTGVGGLVGVVFLALIAPVAGFLLSRLRVIFAPHMFWLLGLMLAFLVLSEWPKGGDRGRPAARFWDAWKSLLAGQATLLLSGLLGFILLYRPVVPAESAFQNIMPAFVGLYAVPWIVTNVISIHEVPRQHVAKSLDLDPLLVTRGGAAGAGGGLFAAFFPILTGGMGGLLAGHATAARDERIFILSQGTSKVVYYVGALMLLFVPDLHLTRGGMAWMMSGFYTPATPGEYWTVIATILISGGLSFLLLVWLTKATIRIVQRVNFRVLSLATLAIVTSVVLAMTGPGGFLVMVVSTGIGLIPVLFHSRRMNCMGVLLIPVMLNMAGAGPAVARFFGLVA